MAEDKVMIVGLGHVGQPLAVKLAEAGLVVYGVDSDSRVIDGLGVGRSHVREPGLAALLEKHLGHNLFVGLPPSVDVAEIGTIVVAVDSNHPRNKRTPELSSLRRSAAWLARRMRAGQSIILRTTVPIGTTRQVVLPVLQRSGLVAGTDFSLAYCPERTVEGAALREIDTVPQIVGAIDEDSGRHAERLFRKLTQHVVRVSSLEAAETIKLIDNAYRDTRFAFANSVAEACEALGLNSWEVIQASNFQYPRNSIPVPSPGVGGACIPKDSRYLSYSARQGGLRLSLVEEARRVNESAPLRLATRLEQVMPLDGARVFVAGFAFKGVPETADTRGSPTLPFVAQIKRCGAKITGYDPAVANEHIQEAGAVPVNTLEEGLRDCDVAVFMTNHPQFTALGVDGLAQNLRAGAMVVDGWGLLDPSECATRGIRYLGVGVGSGGPISDVVSAAGEAKN